MLGDPPRPTASPSPALDRDLYCLTCGYNLRGLSGDPIRCPECGNLNPIGDVEIPAEIITNTLRRMESSPAVCVGAVLLGAPLPVTIILAFWHGNTRSEFIGDTPCFVVMTLVAAVMWLIACAIYRDSCGTKPGWFHGLMAYHFWGLLLIVGTLGGIASGMTIIVAAAERWDGAFPGAAPVIVLVGLLLLGVGVVLWVRATYRRAIAPLHTLQREVAVSIAREETRKKLARPHKHLLG